MYFNVLLKSRIKKTRTKLLTYKVSYPQKSVKERSNLEGRSLQ